MAEDRRTPSEFPFQVWADPGTIVKGFDNPDVALGFRDGLNAKAVEMGLITRYELRGGED